MSVISFWSKVTSWTEGFIRKLSDKAYRDAYVADHVRTGIAFQIRALREARTWNQTQLGQRMGKPQNVISRLEDPDYGKVTLSTLLQVASTFDVGLIVQFVEWDDWLLRMEDVSPAALQKESFNADRLRALSVRQFGIAPEVNNLVWGFDIGTGTADVLSSPTENVVHRHGHEYLRYPGAARHTSLLTQYTAAGMLETSQTPHYGDEPSDDLVIQLPAGIVQQMEAGHD
jgi:transcriptional regulator with XRE-family HTH domain